MNNTQAFKMIAYRAAVLFLLSAALIFESGGARAEGQPPFAKICDSNGCDVWTVANLRFEGILANVVISGSRFAADGRSPGPATRISYFVGCTDTKPSVTRQPSNINYLLDKGMFNSSFSPTEYPVLYNLWWAVCRNERLKYIPAQASPDKKPVRTPAETQSQVNQSSQANGPKAGPDKTKENILFIYQQYLVLKICEAKSDGVISLNATRDSLKKFDQSIRAKGYDPEALFAQAKDAPLAEALNVLLASLSLLPMMQGAEKMELLSVCQRMIANEAQLINLAVSSPAPEKNIEKIGEKDF